MLKLIDRLIGSPLYQRVCHSERLNVSLIECFVILCVGLLAIGAISLVHRTGAAVGQEIASASEKAPTQILPMITPNLPDERPLVSRR